MVVESIVPPYLRGRILSARNSRNVRVLPGMTARGVHMRWRPLPVRGVYVLCSPAVVGGVVLSETRQVVQDAASPASIRI